MTPEEINGILDIPEWDKASPVKTEEAKFLYDFIKEKGIKKTLEIGFAFGKSASHIMAASEAEHIAIDPFQSNYKDFGLKNLEKLKMKDLLKFYPDYSHNVLPKLANEDLKFEFIFIDGDHKFDGIFVDFYYSDLIIEDKGYLLFHDTWMRSTRLVEQFIKKNRSDYKHVPTSLRNFSLFQKISKDYRDGMYFREFYTFKSFIIHPVIVWLTNGKKNIFKSAIYKLKEIIK